MDKFLIEIQAKLDELKSKENINEDIVKIQKQIDTLKIQADIDSKSISDLVKQLEKISNQKINISDVNIDKNAAAKAGKEANKEIEKNLNVDDIINKAVKRMTELTGRSSNKIFTNRLDQIRNTLNEDKDIAKLFDASIEKTFNTSSLSNMVNIIRSYKKELLSFDDISNQFASTITSQFSTVIPESQKIDESIFEICKTFARFKNETQESYQTTGKNFFNWIQENATESEKEIFHAAQGFEEFQAALRGISFNNSNLFDYSTTLGLDTLNYNSDAIESLLRKESDLISESNIAEQKLSELRQALIDAFHINANPDGSLPVTLDQLQKIVLKCPQAQEYIDKINSSLVQISKSEANAENTASSFAEETVKSEERKQQAIQETVKVQEQLKKNGNIIQQTDFAVSFDTKGEAEKYFNTLSKTVSVQEKLGENKNLESFIVEVKNAEGVVEKLTYKYNELNDTFEYSGGSINDNGVIKQINTISAKADSLQTKLDKLKANYSDTNASRPIKDSNNISELSQQYDKVSQAIENVRNADNTTFLSMVSNAQNEISVLESMVAQFRNAENVATQMKSVDISSGIAQAQERLGKLKANSFGFEQMTQTIHELDIAIEGVGDKSSLDKFLNSLKVAEAQLGRVKAEAKELSKVNEIQLSMEGKNVKSKNYDLQIDTEIKKLKDLGFTDEEVTQKVKVLTDAQAELKRVIDSSDFDSVVSKNKAIIETDKERTVALNQVRTAYAQLKNDTSQFYNAKRQTKLSDDIQLWLNKNGRASQEAKEKLNEYFKELNGGRVSVSRLEYIQEQFNSIKLSQTSIGKIGKSLSEQFKSIGSSVAQLFSIAKAFDTISSSTKEAISELKEVDTLLTEISKANDTLSKSDLKNIGNGAFEVASKYGKKATDYLSGVQEASRAGYENAASIAELSVAAQGAGDMTAELANQYIIATDKAYKLGESVEKLTEILDGSNYITNHNAVNMTELAEGMSIVGSQAASLGVGVNEATAVLGTMIATTQQSGSEMARAFRAILLNLQQVTDEEEGIDAEGLTKYEKACEALNVSLKETKNGVTTLREPMAVIKDLAEEYSKLDSNDIRRTNLLSSVGGKMRSNALNAILENYDMYSDMLEQYKDGVGSMASEAEKTANSWEGSLNRLHNTWVDTIGNIADSDAIITIINSLNNLLSYGNKLTNFLGSIGTIGLGAGLFAGIKNVGMAELN